MLSAEVQERVDAGDDVAEPDGTGGVRAAAFRRAFDRRDQPRARTEDECDEAQHLPRGEENAAWRSSRSCATERVTGRSGDERWQRGRHASHRRRPDSALLRRDVGRRRGARADAPGASAATCDAAYAACSRCWRRWSNPAAPEPPRLRTDGLGAARSPNSTTRRARMARRGSCSRRHVWPGSRPSRPRHGAFLAGRLSKPVLRQRSAQARRAPSMRERMLLADLGEHLDRSRVDAGGTRERRRRRRGHRRASAGAPRNSSPTTGSIVRPRRPTAIRPGRGARRLEQVLVDVAASPDSVSAADCRRGAAANRAQRAAVQGARAVLEVRERQRAADAVAGWPESRSARKVGKRFRANAR